MRVSNDATGLPPATRYVNVGDSDVAYQVLGDGDVDVLLFAGLGSHIELMVVDPDNKPLLDHLTAFSRVIHFDRRGTGASDGVPGNAIPTVEEWTEDIRAVLDAAESRETAIIASLDAGPIAVLFAALHPERVRALVLINTSARYVVADDYPIGRSVDEIEALVELLAATWGTAELIAVFNPERATDRAYLQEAATWGRFAATPRTAAAQYRYLLGSIDVRQALPLIQVPTLVLHVKESPLVPVEHGRYIAEHIKGATFMELPGASLSATTYMTQLIDAQVEFLTGERPPVAVEQVLATVVFTDIVRSTETVAALGDQRWHKLLDADDERVREQLRIFRGKEINTTGDGFVASFDGPARAIRCGEAIIGATRELGLEVRIGVHTGECELRGDDLGGLAVHIAARIGALTAAGQILVSGTVKDLVVGSRIAFEDLGEHELKGVPGNWKLLSVTRVDL